MSIHAADALMGIFGFKRVADDEITLDNPPSLDDDSGSLNEGMEMEEVKNEGLEVERWNQAVFDLETAEEKTIDVVRAEDYDKALAGYAVRDAWIAAQEEQIKALQSGENCWQSGYGEGRRMGGKHCALTIDQLRAELAALNAELDASKFCADVADDLRAELAAAKETISRYETTAENCEAFRDALAAIYAAPVAKQVVMPEALDRVFITGESCDGVYRVVIQSETLKEMQSVHNWIVRLNAADQEGAQDE